MYKIGDLVVYGCEGVCKIEDIGVPEMASINKNRIYYKLSPLYLNETIYAPTDQGNSIRPVITRSEALDMIRQIPQVEVEVPENGDQTHLKEYYQTFLRSHDCFDLIRIIKILAEKEKTAAAKGNRLGQSDDEYRKKAEDLFYGECAVALQISKDEVRDFIQEMSDGFFDRPSEYTGSRP